MAAENFSLEKFFHRNRAPSLASAYICGITVLANRVIFCTNSIVFVVMWNSVRTARE